MIFQGDLIIKTMIELGMEDMRKNPWLIDDMLSDCVTNQYLRQKYGQKQIDACKEWFANNQVDVYMRDRNDRDRMPCVTISLGNSPEKEEMKSMGDQSTETVKLLPNTIGKPIPYVVRPFTPLGYDSDSGIVGVDPDTAGLDAVSAGMILVNPDTGEGYVIVGVTGEGIEIEPDLALDASRLGVVPQYQYYQARVEHTFFQETYTIGCHAHGDPQTLLWLWSIVKYCILRYREALLEANGFSQSSLASTDMMEDRTFSGPGGETGWSRFINLTGMVENTWIKSPRRFVESIVLKKRTPTGYIGGISIISNTYPDIEDRSTVNWYVDTEAEVAAEAAADEAEEE